MRKNYMNTVLLSISISILWGYFSTSWAQKDELIEILKKPFELTPAYRVGDKDLFHIRTVYLDMNDSGMVAQTRIVDGYYSREIAKIAQNKRYDRFVWKMVKIGQREGKGEISEYAALPYAANFQYEFSYAEIFPGSSFPIDFSSIPKTMEAWCFVVNAIDAHTFDIIIEPAKNKGIMKYVGDSAVMAADNIPIPIDFPPLFTESRFINGPVDFIFKGITLYKDHACAIIAFRSDESRVHMNVNMMDMKLPTDGISYYWGEIFFSLDSRRILWGQIIERVDMITALVQLGKPMRHVTRREITLEQIEQADFDRLIP